MSKKTNRPESDPGTFDYDSPGADEHTKADASAGELSPDQHFKVEHMSGPRRKRDNDLAMHAAASALHGWAEHAHHSGAPIALTADAYAAALVAVDTFKPHQAALSPYKGKGL